MTEETNAVLVILLTSYSVVMPRDVCSVYGCATARSHGYGIFRVSLFEDNAQQIWRDHLASIFGPRVGGEQFVDLLNEGRAMICEKHFKEADVITFAPSGQRPSWRRLKAYSIPDRNLPDLKPIENEVLAQMIEPHPSTSVARLAKVISKGTWINCVPIVQQ